MTNLHKVRDALKHCNEHFNNPLAITPAKLDYLTIATHDALAALAAIENQPADTVRAQPDDCAKAFEEWANRKRLPMQYDEIFGYYRYTATEDAWAVWQAAWNSRVPMRESINQKLLASVKELAEQPCSTVGLEDVEGGCCWTCRARGALSEIEGAES